MRCESIPMSCYGRPPSPASQSRREGPAATLCRSCAARGERGRASAEVVEHAQALALVMLGDVTGRGRSRWWPSWCLAVLERVGLVARVGSLARVAELEVVASTLGGLVVLVAEVVLGLGSPPTSRPSG